MWLLKTFIFNLPSGNFSPDKFQIISTILFSNSKEILFNPYLEESGNWDSYIIIHNPEDIESDIEINFYNLDGSLAYTEDIEDMPGHSTLFLCGDDYKEHWDEPQANVKITVTGGANIIGCATHMEPNYYIGFSINLLTILT